MMSRPFTVSVMVRAEPVGQPTRAAADRRVRANDML